MLDAATTLLLLVDAWGGHFRRGFVHLAQYAPFPVGVLLMVCASAVAIAPPQKGFEFVMQLAAWLAVLAGLTGFVFHHYYGIVRKPGGYRQLLDSALYGAPPLAPLGLTLVGVIALLAQRGLSGAGAVGGVPLRSALLVATVVGLVGAMLQAAILHFRGAFNQRLMYVPLVIPLVASAAGIWVIVEPNPAARMVALWLFWLTLLSGFVGLGMHLRGFDRQMGGLYVPLFSWLQGPPALAPALFSGFAAIGLVAVRL